MFTLLLAGRKLVVSCLDKWVPIANVCEQGQMQKLVTHPNKYVNVPWPDVYVVGIIDF
jgi:hypothetical protein